MVTLRIGAYILAGDPVWLRSSLRRYYEYLDDLVVLVPEDGLGWTGRPVPAQECLAIVKDIDVRRISRAVEGRWIDEANPMRADTAQRQAGVDLLSHVDWILQIDNDEVVPDPVALLDVASHAPDDVTAIEWPMRVLYRHLRDLSWAAVSGSDGQPVFDYPGPVMIRPGVRLTNARRCDGETTLRMTVVGDSSSLQLTRPLAPNERRVEGVETVQAILHNSWGRSPRDVWRKTRTWGHAAGIRGAAYYWLRWLPSRHLWRWARNIHPFADGLWPALARLTLATELVDERDLLTRRKFAPSRRVRN